MLIVVIALDLLDLGDAGVGFLNSAIGVGGLLGAFAAAALVGRRNLASPFGIGIVLWGVPIALIGLWPEPLPALLLLGVLGVGEHARRRRGADATAARGARRGPGARVRRPREPAVATLGLGAILAPLLVGAFGARPALLAHRRPAPARDRALRGAGSRPIDQGVGPAEQLELLRALPIFAPLPPADVEHLAASLSRFASRPARTSSARATPATASTSSRTARPTWRRGQPGTASAAATTSARSRSCETYPDGDGRTAETDTDLLALERDEFLAAVTGHAPSAEVANTVVASRLSGLRSGAASI